MVNVEPIFGPMLIGVFLNTILYGIVIVQSIIYYLNYPKDSKWIRYFVLYLFICETINTLLDIGMIYEPLVARFGTERAVTRLPILFTADPLLTVLISTPVQLFICWRITVLHRLSSIKIMPVSFLIAFLSLCSFSGGIGVTVYNGKIPTFEQLTDSRWAVILWLVSSALADILITICLVLSLRKCRTGFEGIDNIVNRNIKLAIHTGALTSLFTILDFVVFQAAGTKTTANFTFDFALAKLYTNSLLSTFNARALSEKDKAQYNVLFGPQEIDVSSQSLRQIPSSQSDIESMAELKDEVLP